MIEWGVIVMVTAAGFLGNELAERWTVEQGMVIFQPRWAYRILTWLAIFGIALFLEAANTALAAPSVPDVWFVIAGAACTFAAIWTRFARELQLAKREIVRLKSG